MRILYLAASLLCVGAPIAFLARSEAASTADEVIQLERTALDRWGNGDPDGFLAIYAPDVTYFDVVTERRLDGHAAMTDYYRPIAGKIKVLSYQMIGTKVQHAGSAAVLTYNLRSEAVQADGSQQTVSWNSTSVYARSGRQWKLLHSHWSLTAPACLRGIM